MYFLFFGGHFIRNNPWKKVGSVYFLIIDFSYLAGFYSFFAGNLCCLSPYFDYKGFRTGIFSPETF